MIIMLSGLIAFAQLKVTQQGNVGVGTTNPSCKLHIAGGDALTETRMWTNGNKISRYWAVNYKFAYSFGVDADALGCIWGNINLPNPTRILTFADSWISESPDNYLNGINVKYMSVGSDRKNRIHMSNTGSYGTAFNYDFNPGCSEGLILENVYGNGSSGVYLDAQCAIIWSPGKNAQEDIVGFYSSHGSMKRISGIKNNGHYILKETIAINNGSSQSKITPLISDALSSIMQIQGVVHQEEPETTAKNDENQEYIETINGHIVPFIIVRSKYI